MVCQKQINLFLCIALCSSMKIITILQGKMEAREMWERMRVPQ